MFTNTTSKDVKKAMIDNRLNQIDLAELAGTSRQNVNYILRTNTGVKANRVFVRMLEALGYDIEVRLVKRGENGG